MNERNRKLIISLVGALIITFICKIGLLEQPDMYVKDAIYQRPETVPGDIVIIGIDENDFKELGPYNTWDRTIMASALEALASDPDNLPAVVAVDFLDSGHTTPEADERLAKAGRSGDEG